MARLQYIENFTENNDIEAENCLYNKTKKSVEVRYTIFSINFTYGFFIPA